MKLVALLLLAVLLFAGNVVAADKPEAQPDFRETLSRATLAVYKGKQVCEFSSIQFMGVPIKIWGCSFKEAFTCTATVVERTSQIDYIGLTTGHCFDWNDEAQGIKYYVADNVRREPVLHEIEVLKRESDDRYDYAIFKFQSITQYPVIDVYQGSGIPSLGSKILNVNFSFGITKEIVEGPIVSGIIGDTESEDKPYFQRRFLVQLPFGPGASGSPVVDMQTNQMVGLVEMMFNGTQMAAVVIPTGDNLVNFIQDDSAGIKPEPPPVTSMAPDTKVMWRQFVKYIKSLFGLK